ncbi:MAG: Gfo/Idh/MocA family oxidoreductase [Pseudomonadales bacterium]
MIRIALLGCGAIGSRHLQALMRLPMDSEIFVIDPDERSVEIARQRADEVHSAASIQLRFGDAPDQLPATVDVAIVATSSRHRLPVLRALLANTGVANLILEKVLFQRLEDYAEATQLIEHSGSVAWVNCPRRMMQDYAPLEPLLRGHGKIEYSVIGEGWGLACNAIHFIDHLAMYLQCCDFQLDCSALEPVLHQSKRAGYLELMGTLVARFANGVGELTMTCQPAETARLTTTIENGRYRLVLHSGEDSATVLEKATQQVRTVSLRMEPQSQLTDQVVTSLLASEHCQLTPYLESARLHRPLIAGLAKFVGTVSGKEVEVVDIT